MQSEEDEEKLGEENPRTSAIYGEILCKMNLVANIRIKGEKRERWDKYKNKMTEIFLSKMYVYRFKKLNEPQID